MEKREEVEYDDLLKDIHGENSREKEFTRVN